VTAEKDPPEPRVVAPSGIPSSAAVGTPSAIQILTTLEQLRSNIESLDFSNATLDGSSVVECTLKSVALRDASVRNSTFDDSTFANSYLDGTDFSKTSFRRADVNHHAFHRTNLTGAIFDQADIRGTEFLNANADNASFLDVKVDSRTQLTNASVRGCKIERATLEMLTDYGGLTKGARMLMDIQDPVAIMRSHYSGVWHYIHILAVVAFLAPYVVFLMSRWLESLTLSCSSVTCEPLATALFRYIYTGGMGSGVAWLPFTTFCYSLGYNVLRSVLWFKTKHLELHEQASGLPAVFSLKGNWGTALKLATWGFYVNVGLVLLHSLHFLGRPVPWYP
jgi:hypothetical protein